MYIHALIVYVLKNIFRFIIVGFIYTTSFANIFAQNFKLILKAKDSSNTHILKNIQYNKLHSSKKSVLNEVDSISIKVASLGYINNQYVLTKKDSLFYGVFSLQKKIELIRIYYPKNSIEKKFLKQLALNVTDIYFEIPLYSVEETLNTIVAHFENLGHSFSSIYLSNLLQQHHLLTATLNLNISNKRNIDHVIVKGYPEFPKKFLNHYLNIIPTKIFNLNSLNELNDLINTIPFINQIKKPEVLFTKDSTTLYIYVKKKSNSNFDGILGFSNEDKGKIKFNGYLNLKLNNILNKGESFSINWKNNQKKNSSLKLNFASPYIFNSNINLDGSFSIFKQDTSYINSNSILKLGYNINNNNSIHIIGNTEKSDLSSGSSTNTNVENFKKSMIGISYVFKILDNPLNFNRYKFLIDVGYLIGNRTNELEKEQQRNFKLFVKYTAHINNRNSIFIKTSTEILNTLTPFENELFRIGGFNSIRGFDEKSIFTSKYNVTNFEYHYQLNSNSHLYSITDVAILKNINTKNTEQLYGLGLGYYLNTKRSILNLSYAIGKNYNLPFNLNNSKIHIKMTFPF